MPDVSRSLRMLVIVGIITSRVLYRNLVGIGSSTEFLGTISRMTVFLFLFLRNSSETGVKERNGVPENVS